MMKLLKLWVVLIATSIVSCRSSQLCPVCPAIPDMLPCPDFPVNQPIDCPVCPDSQSIPTCSDSPVGLIEIPNIKAAMGGFNPILSNPNQQPDPGLRGQIFEPYTQLEDGRVILSPFITKAWANQHCTLNFVAKTMKNYNAYRQSKTSSYYLSVEAGFSSSADIWIASFHSSFGFGLEIDNEESKIRNFFQETNGEIVMSTNECRTHTIELESYLTPAFTSSFEEGLKFLNYAAMEPNSTESKNVYIRFVKTFGTHYLKKTHLGAKLVFEKIYISKSKSVEEEEQRKNCVRASASGSVGGSLMGVGSTEASFSSNMHHCSDSASGRSYLTDNGIQTEKVTSIGSLPSKDPEAWARNIFDSVPISFELEPLSALFDKLEFYFLPFDSYDSSNVYFNGSAVSEFFREMSSQYCSLVLARDCTATTTGCGVNSLCRSEEDCVNDPTIPLGHRCVHRYGGVITAGGSYGSVYLSTTDAIETHQRPSLPVKIKGLSLTRVRDTLYSCGGKTDTGAVTDRCYKLALRSSAPTWSETVRLPATMYFHNALAVGDKIWFLYNSELHSLNTQTEKFKTFRLPFGFPNGRCAVANATHSYTIAAGNRHNQVWVNKEASNPAKWKRVATLPRHSYGLACHWPEGNTIFITGGGRGSGNVYTSLLNTVSNTITEAADMLQARAYHKMMMLDGKPAVIGGRDSVSTDKTHWLSSIETYNTVTDSWQPHILKLRTAMDSFGLAQLAG